MSALVGNLLVFGGLLRAAGLDGHVGRLLDVAEALSYVDVGNREDVYFTCRALLVHRHDDVAIFDRLFDAFWRLHGDAAPRRPAASDGAPPSPDHPHDQPHDQAHDQPRGQADDQADDQARDQARDQQSSAAGLLEVSGLSLDESTPDATTGVFRTWSDARTLAHKDFAAFAPEEVGQAKAALAQLDWTPGHRRTRRWERGRGPRLDLRRALAQSVRTRGDLIKLPTRRRQTRPRPVVLLCDISGSMERYSRMLLHFAHALGRHHRRVEVFVFSTQLTRVTGDLRRARLDEAVAEVSQSVHDWSGGTRIGEALRELLRRWRRPALHGGPVVLLISDGWDRGDPLVLRDQVRRLQRNCHRLIWLNPLIGTADYAPLTRGLQAALPFVDDFLPARTLANLADLALHLNSLPRRS